MASNRFFSPFIDACTNFLNLPFVNKHRKNYGYAMRGVYVFAFTPHQKCLQYKEPSSDSPLFSKYLFTNPADRKTLEVLRLRGTEAADTAIADTATADTASEK